MKFNYYKNILNEKNIYLFDHQYRISHYKLNLLSSNDNYNQTGGGKIISNKSKKELEQMLDLLLSNNMNLGYIYNFIYK